MGGVEFWFDFASTYSYLAAMRIEKAAAAANVPIEWRPFLLGPVFQRQGWNDSPFNIYPARGRYMWKEMERFSDRYGLRFRRPSVFPRNSVLAARVALACEGRKSLPDLVRAIYGANFEEDREISERGVVADLLASIGEDPDAILADALSPENKPRLRERTERAWDLGIFGAPSFIAGGELFWGNDRMEMAFEWHQRMPQDV